MFQPKSVELFVNFVSQTLALWVTWLEGKLGSLCLHRFIEALIDMLKIWPKSKSFLICHMCRNNESS